MKSNDVQAPKAAKLSSREERTGNVTHQDINTLLKLSISEPLGRKSIRALEHVLPGMSQLTDIDLTGAQLGLRGGEGLVTLFKGLCKPSDSNPCAGILAQIRSLSLSSNRVDCAGAAILARVFRSSDAQHLKLLDLSENSIWEDGARALCECIVSPGKLCALRELRLGGNSIRDRGAQSLAKVLHPGSQNENQLEILDLSHNYIFDEGAKALFSALERKSPLRILSLKGNPLGLRTKFAALRSLETNSTLKIVHLDSFSKGGEDSENAVLHVNQGPLNSSLIKAQNDQNILACTLDDLLRESLHRNELNYKQKALRCRLASVDDELGKATQEQNKWKKLPDSQPTHALLSHASEIKQALTKVQEENDSLARETARVSKRISDAEHAILKLKEERSLLCSSREKVETQLHNSRTHLMQLEHVKAQLEARYADRLTTVSAAEDSLAHAEQETEHLRARASTAQASDAQMRERIAQSTITVERLIENISSFDQKCREIRARLGALEQSKVELLNQLGRAEADEAAREEVLRELEANKSEAVSKLASIEQDCFEGSEVVQAKEAENESLQAKLDQLLARQQGEAVRGILEKLAKVVAERDELAIANMSAKSDKESSINDHLELEKAREQEHNRLSSRIEELETSLLKSESARERLELELNETRLSLDQARAEVEMQKRNNLENHQLKPEDRMHENSGSFEIPARYGCEEKTDRNAATMNEIFAPSSSSLTDAEKTVPELESEQDSRSEQKLPEPDDTIPVSSFQRESAPSLPPRPLDPKSASQYRSGSSHSKIKQMAPPSAIMAPAPIHCRTSVVESSSRTSQNQQAENRKAGGEGDEIEEEKEDENLRLGSTVVTKGTGDKEESQLSLSLPNSPVSDSRVDPEQSHFELLTDGFVANKRSAGSYVWSQTRFVWMGANFRTIFWSKGIVRGEKYKSLPFWTVTEIVGPTQNSHDQSERDAGDGESKGAKTMWGKLRKRLPSGPHGTAKATSIFGSSKKVITLLNRDHRDCFELQLKNPEEAQRVGDALRWAVAQLRAQKAAEHNSVKPNELPQALATSLQVDRSNECAGSSENSPNSSVVPINSSRHAPDPEEIDAGTYRKIQACLKRHVLASTDDDAATYRMLREKVVETLQLESNLDSAAWKLWFRESIDAILEEADAEDEINDSLGDEGDEDEEDSEEDAEEESELSSDFSQSESSLSPRSERTCESTRLFAFGDETEDGGNDDDSEMTGSELEKDVEGDFSDQELISEDYI